MLCQGQKGGPLPSEREARKVGGHLTDHRGCLGANVSGRLKNQKGLEREEGKERGGEREREGKGKPAFGRFPENRANKCSLERRQKYLSSIGREDTSRVRTGESVTSSGFHPSGLSSLSPDSLGYLKDRFI